MSVLLLHLDPALAEALTERLVHQSDEVRWLGEEKDARRQQQLGAFIARGDASDDDLVWRTSLGVRSIVFAGDRSPEELTALLKGAKAADVERLICVASELSPRVHDALSGCGLEYVLLLTGGGSWLSRRKIGPEDLAEAVDAADDHAGPLHEVLDLTEEPGWARLQLSPPTKKRG